MRLRAIVSLLREAFFDWREDKASRLAAALAYYTVFSVAPLLVTVIAIAGLAFGREAAEGRILSELQGLLGRGGAEFVQTLIQSASRPRAAGLAAAIGLVTLLLGAAGVFSQLKDGLNTIWEVAPKPGRGLMGILRDHFASFAMVTAIGFLLLVSLVVSAGLTWLGETLGERLGGLPTLLQLVNVSVSLGVVTLLFALIYRILPDVEIAWSDVWLGAAATALLFTVGKFLIGLYLGSGGVGSAYGAAGALVIVLVWVYYSAQIFFFGAELTQVYANRYGASIGPSRNAVALTEEARAQQGIPAPSSAMAHGERESGAPLIAPEEVEVTVVRGFADPGEGRFIAALIGFIVGLVTGARQASKR